MQESLGASVLDHLCAAINRVKVCAWPYAHFYLEKAFPDPVFAQILNLLPEASAYAPDNPQIHTRADGLVTRNIFSLSAPSVGSLADPCRSFWTEIAEALMAPQLRHTVFARLSRDLTRRFRIAADELDSVLAYAKPALVKDLGGYEIAPHRDTRSKIVTMQYYMPNDMSKAEHGTAVYRHRLFRLKNLLSIRNRFEKVKQFSFAPNSGYAFAVGPRSWHGRDPVPMALDERNSLMLIYYARPDKGW